MGAENITDLSPETTFTDPESIDGGEELVIAFEDLINQAKRGVPENLSYENLIGEQRVELIFDNKTLSTALYRITDRNERVLVAKAYPSEHDGKVMFDFNSELGALPAASLIENVVGRWPTEVKYNE